VGRYLAVVGLALLVACAEPAEPAGDPTAIAWELESGTVGGESIPIVDGHPITLSFTDDGAGGTAACNGYGGSYAVTGTRITFTDLAWTEMGCIPEEIMDSERKYLDALPRVEAFATSDERLTLSGDGVELVFAALSPVPTSELTGTVWVLESLVQGASVSTVTGERATLELFSDGSMLGSTGCRTLNGNYTIAGAEVQMTELTANGDCPSDLEDQDTQVVTVLGSFRATVEGETLTLTSPGSMGLRYRGEG